MRPRPRRAALILVTLLLLGIAGCGREVPQLEPWQIGGNASPQTAFCRGHQRVVRVALFSLDPRHLRTGQRRPRRGLRGAGRGVSPLRLSTLLRNRVPCALAGV